MKASIDFQNAPLDEPVYHFLDRKRAEGKLLYVYMTSGANKFLRIYHYHGKARDYLATQDAVGAALAVYP